MALSVADAAVAADSVGDRVLVKDGDCLDLHGRLGGKGRCAPLAVSDWDVHFGCLPFFS